MSLINNLRQQALNKQAEEEARAKKQAELLQYFRQYTQPRLLRLYRTLHELVNHLNYLNKDLWVEYPLSPAGHKVPMRQADYKVTIDSLDNTQDITFYARCSGKMDVLYKIGDPTVLEKHVQYFKHYNIKYQSRSYQNEYHQIVGADISIKTELPVRLQFQADIENQCIKLTLVNLPVLGSTLLKLRPHAMDDKFIDDLGHFILREKDDFIRLDISDIEKEHIRTLVEHDQRQRDWEIRIARDQ